MSSKKFNFSYLLPKHWPSWLMIALSWVLARMPLSWQQASTKWLTAQLAKTNIGRVRTIRANIDLCFPEASPEYKQELINTNLQASIQVLFDVVNVVWQRKDMVLKQGRILGEEHLQAALASGKPTLLVSAHFTSFVLAIAKLTELTPSHVVYRRLDSPVLESHLVQRVRDNYPLTLIHRKDIRDMLVELGSGGTVIIVPDQDFGLKRGTFIPFFGISTATITTIPQYAQQTGAQVLLYSVYRENDEYVVSIDPVLENYPSGDDVTDTQLWSDWLEAKIRLHPEQYFWMHKRFKTRPAGEPNPYKKT